jgi:hypothetical protein
MTAFAHLSLWASSVSGADAQSAAKDELSKPEYHADDPNALQRLWEWILSKIEHGVGEASWNNRDTVILLFLAALICLTVYMVIRAGRIKRSERAAVTDWLSPHDDVDHRQAALRHTSAGEYDLALREWLRECVRILEDRGIVDPTPGRTGSELAHLAAPRIPKASPALYAAVEAFNEVWFADRAATAGDAESGRLAAEAVAHAREADPETPVTGGYLVPS